MKNKTKILLTSVLIASTLAVVSVTSRSTYDIISENIEALSNVIEIRVGYREWNIIQPEMAVYDCGYQHVWDNPLAPPSNSDPNSLPNMSQIMYTSTNWLCDTKSWYNGTISGKCIEIVSIEIIDN